MTEKFLSFIWQSKLFQPNIEIENEKLEIINPGEVNTDAGPDFINTKIKFGNTIWVGNAEIHLNSSDWYSHDHDKNSAFDNVILHIVSKNDKEVYTSRGRKIPTIELKFNNTIWEKYTELTQNTSWVRCEKELQTIEPVTLISWLSTLEAEHLESKILQLANDLQTITGDWDEIFYRQLLRSFGFHINSEPFILLSKSILYKIIEKYSGNITQLEALLFGQAGFLQDDYSSDEYYLTLKKEYEFLRIKYQLQPINVHLWKFMRLRPANFPTLRIAQIAGILYKNNSMLSNILKASSIENVKKIFSYPASGYWENHYHFGRMSKYHGSIMGADSINIIIINTIIPFYFLYGKKVSNSSLCNKALTFLEQLPPENNKQIDKWRKTGISPKSAFDTQALLFLKKEYCDKKRCIECRIGAKILLKTKPN